MQRKMTEQEFIKAVQAGDINKAKEFINENNKLGLEKICASTTPWSILTYAIFEAAYNNQSDMLIFLIKEGERVSASMSINCHYSHMGATPLIYMARYNRLEAVRVLLDRRVDVNCCTKNDAGSISNIRMGLNWTALMWAAYNGNEDMVTLLLNVKGINLFAKDYDGKTAADIAKSRKHDNIAKLIYEAMLNSTSAETLLDYGIYFFEKKEYELAIRAFEKAIKLNDKLEKAHYNLGVVLAAQANEKSTKKSVSTVEKSITTATPAAQNEPASTSATQSVTVSAADKKKAEDCFNKGREYSAKGEYSTALTLYQQAIKHSPTNSEALSSAGYACFMLNQFAESEQYHLDACRLSPGNWIHFNNLGSTQYKLRKYDAAEKSLRMAKQLDPNSYATCAWLGHVYWTQHKFADAASQYDHAIRLGYLAVIYTRFEMHLRQEGPVLTNDKIKEYSSRLAKSSNQMDKQYAKFFLESLRLKEIYQQLGSDSQPAHALPDALKGLEAQEIEHFKFERTILELLEQRSLKSASELLALINRLLNYPESWSHIHANKPDCSLLDQNSLSAVELVIINDICDYLERQAMKQKYVASVKNHLIAYRGVIEEFAETWKKAGWFGASYDTSEIAAIRKVLRDMNGSDAKNILSAYVDVMNQLGKIENHVSYSSHLRSCATQMKQQLMQIRLTHQPDVVKLPDTERMPENLLFFVPTEEVNQAVKATKRGKQPPMINSTAAILSGMPVSSSVSPLEASQFPPTYPVPPSLLHFPSAPPFDEPPQSGSVTAPVVTQPAYSAQSWQYGTAALMNALPPAPTAPLPTLQYYSMYATPVVQQRSMMEPPAGFQWQPAR